MKRTNLELFIPKHDIKEEIYGVALFKKEDKILLTTTDSYKLIEIDVTDFEPFEYLETGIYKKEAVKIFDKFIKEKFTKEDIELAKVYKSDIQIERYPDYSKIIPGENFVKTEKIYPVESMIPLLKVLESLNVEYDESLLKKTKDKVAIYQVKNVKVLIVANK
jgi:hypothetical protein